MDEKLRQNSIKGDHYPIQFHFSIFSILSSLTFPSSKIKSISRKVKSEFQTRTISGFSITPSTIRKIKNVMHISSPKTHNICNKTKEESPTRIGANNTH